MRVSWNRLAEFALVYVVSYLLLARAWSGGLARSVIEDGTVPPAAFLLRASGIAPAATADGSWLRAPGASLHVLAGCEGTDAWLVLVAGLLVAPMSWPRRLAGLAAGTLIVFALNQARLLALFLALRDHPSWFGTLHGLVAPALLVAAAGLFFLAWTRARPGAPA